MAATQIKKEESQAVGVYQLKNGFWAYRFIVKINGEQKTQRRSKDEESKWGIARVPQLINTIWQCQSKQYKN